MVAEGKVPAVAKVRYRYSPHLPPELRFDPARPYNDLPHLQPRVDVETRAILKACIGARASLAELKAAGELIPNQVILINTIPLLEARASSESTPSIRSRTATAARGAS